MATLYALPMLKHWSLPMSIKMQGTHPLHCRYHSDTPNPVKMACPTGVGSRQRSQVNDSFLDKTESEQYLSGLSARRP